MKTWNNLTYLVTDDVIFAVLDSLPLEWHALDGSVMETDKSVMQHKKEETKLRMVQLAEKLRKEETKAKVQVSWDAMKGVEH